MWLDCETSCYNCGVMIKREQKTVKLSEIKPNPDNPRVIKRNQLKSLQKSLSDFPEMMKLRPIVVDEDGVTINFKDGQASRADGNDAIYRSDASWKKAYALRMTCPWASHLQMKREQGGFLFREFLLWRHLAPVPMLKDEQGRYYSINKTEGETDDDKG